MKHLCLGATMLIVGLLLTACGGGGGGNTQMIPDTQPPDNQPSPSKMQTAFSGTETKDLATIAQSVPDLFNALKQQPNAPIFGSVVQTYNHRSSNVTGVDTSFNGSRFTLQINRQDGSSTTLDTNRDHVADVVGISPSENRVTNRSGAEGYIYRQNGLELTATGVSVEWSNADFTDYLSGGYWFHVDFATQSAEAGAFIDGPEFADTIQVPVTGTATYNGRAGGGYIARHGTDSPLVPEGTFEQGEYEGRVSLTADFGSNQIWGKIDDVGLYNTTILAPDGRIDYDPALLATDYEAILGAVPISQAGTFEGQEVTLTHPELQITSSGGEWAGRFSNMNDSAGNPRAVAGTHRGYITTSGGSESYLIGAFYGATERFQ